MINKIKSNIYQLYFKQFGSTVYLIQLKQENKQKNILIDTSSKENKEELIKDLKQLKINPKNIDILILTHEHWDHNSNIQLFSKASLYKKDNINKLPIKDFQIFKVPGHTKDSIAILYNEVLFSGDTLFHNGIGRTDFPESMPNKMQQSLETLKTLNYKILCPGHI